MQALGFQDGKWMKYFITVLFVILTSSNVVAAEILAKTITWGWVLTLETEGEIYTDKCSLDLVAFRYSKSYRVSLKDKSYNCVTYGPKQIIAGGSYSSDEFTIIVETAIGGDGDHTGQILNIFKLNPTGFTKIATQELFDATYERKNGEITSISGKILFSFCEVCDGPDAAESKDNFFIPVKIIFGCTGICISNTLNNYEIKRMRDKFNENKISYMNDRSLKELPPYILNLEKEFNKALLK